LPLSTILIAETQTPSTKKSKNGAELLPNCMQGVTQTDLTICG